MKRADSAAEYREAAARHFKKGVLTNCFLSPETVAAEIEEGTLFLEEWEQGLFILRGREGWYKLSYYLNSLDTPCPPLPPSAVETAYKLGAENAALSAFFEGAGFVPLFHRVRLKAEAAAGREAPGCRLAKPKDAPRLRAIFSESFHPMGGCVPSGRELKEDIAAGRLIFHEGGGLLRLSEGRASTEICHLALTRSLWGSGAAGELLDFYRSLFPEKRSLVWVNDDNGRALGFYGKKGYAPDGYTSYVHILKG